MDLPPLEMHAPYTKRPLQPVRFYNWRHYYESPSKTPIPANRFCCFFDMRGLSATIWRYIRWTQEKGQGYETFDTEHFTFYLRSLYSQMQSAGIEQITLFFAQLSDLDAFASGHFTHLSINNTLGSLMEQMISSAVYFPENMTVLRLMTTTAKAMGLKVALSFGGEEAALADFRLCKEGETPEGQALKLAEFMRVYNLSSVDFNVDNKQSAAFAENVHTLPFFRHLRTLLDEEKKTLFLTLRGDLTQTIWGAATRPESPRQFRGSLKPLFYAKDSSPIFSTLFHGLNLKMYDEEERYYFTTQAHNTDGALDAWCIEDWLHIIGPSQMQLLHLGFQDAIPYVYPSSASARLSEPFGKAGAKIFLQVKQELKEMGYTGSLGKPFWWPHYDGFRYQAEENYRSPFVSPVMSDFYLTLQILDD